MTSDNKRSAISALSSEKIHRAVRSRALWSGLLAVLLWLYPEATLSAMGAVLHVIVGWIEIALKSLLEGVFGLSHRAAQVVVAWSGLVALILGLYVLIKRAWCFATELFAALQSATTVSLAVLKLVHLRILVGHAIVAATGVALAVYGMV